MAHSPQATILAGGAGLLILFAIFFGIPYLLQTKYTAQLAGAENATTTKPEEFVATHVKTPEPLKALYMTACVAGTANWRQSLAETVAKTELNAIVIDIKDSTGTVSFKSGVPETYSGKGCVVSSMREFIATLHEKQIYVIGRISVFQDPNYAVIHPELAVKSVATGGVWKDRKGLSFIDVGAKPYWDHIVEIANASYKLGFDELNFDYVRYPSDGDMSDASYTWTPKQSASSTDATGQAVSLSKAQVLESFFSYLHDHLKGTGVVMSADLFGMTTTITNDMGIGQVLEKALPYFDYIAPMVYPSHYPNGWNNFANPAEHPYEVVKIAMTEGKRREDAQKISMGIATSTPSKLRPWLQDFNLGATYGADKVQAQIKATYDSGLTSWMIWNAGNKYTESALLPN